MCLIYSPVTDPLPGNIGPDRRKCRVVALPPAAATATAARCSLWPPFPRPRKPKLRRGEVALSRFDAIRRPQSVVVAAPPVDGGGVCNQNPLGRDTSEVEQEREGGRPPKLQSEQRSQVAAREAAKWSRFRSSRKT